MLKRLKTNRSLVRELLFLSFLGCIPTVAARGQTRKPVTNEPARVSQSEVTKALATSFGPALQAVNGFKPFYLTGDFNGDGMQDLLVVVRIKLRRSELPKDVLVLNPFYKDPGYGPAYPPDPAAKPTLAFAIIHGAKAGWKTSESTGKFLLVGASPILAMEHDREKSAPESGMELMRKRARPRKGRWPPPAAKGDSIYLQTEGSDSILFTYRPRVATASFIGMEGPIVGKKATSLDAEIASASATFQARHRTRIPRVTRANAHAVHPRFVIDDPGSGCGARRFATHNDPTARNPASLTIEARSLE